MGCPTRLLQSYPAMMHVTHREERCAGCVDLRNAHIYVPPIGRVRQVTNVIREVLRMDSRSPRLAAVELLV